MCVCFGWLDCLVVVTTTHSIPSLPLPTFIHIHHQCWCCLIHDPTLPGYCDGGACVITRHHGSADSCCMKVADGRGTLWLQPAGRVKQAGTSSCNDAGW
jgi:hypothetical protein